MKINVLLPDIVRTPSGGHKVIYEYCNRLAVDGNDVTLYFLPGKLFNKFHLPKFIRLILVKIYGETVNPTWFSLNKNIQKHVLLRTNQFDNADVCIATGVNTARIIFNLPSDKGKKAYFIQDFENWEYSDSFVYKTYAYGMRNIAVSNWLKKIVDQHSKQSCILISNGIDGSIFYDQKKVRVHHSITFHYRSQSHKGCQYAFKTIKLLETKYPDLTVNIISSEYRKFDLQSNWKFYFNINPTEIAEINNTSEVFICSTIDEGFGLPGLEAMACGCALASTDYIGVHEYAIDGVNALLSPVKDPQAMADNISKLFDDEKLRKQIVEVGIETGKEKSLENSYQKFKKTLIGLANE